VLRAAEFEQRIKDIKKQEKDRERKVHIKFRTGLKECEKKIKLKNDKEREHSREVFLKEKYKFKAEEQKAEI